MVREVLIPAAGLGTRFLPFTKAVPKELLPVGNIPAIDYILEECVNAGIYDIGMIVSEHKKMLIDYLRVENHTADKLAHGCEHTLVDTIEYLHRALTLHEIYQDIPKGLGHAILLGQRTITQPFFAVCLPDDIIIQDRPLIAELMELSQRYQASVIAVIEVEPDEVSAYGVINPGALLEPNVLEVQSLIEKPVAHEAPSNIAIIGRYVLTSSIFKHLKHLPPGVHNEIQLTDALNALAQDPAERVIAKIVTGKRFDIGTPQGLLKINNYLATL